MLNLILSAATLGMLALTLQLLLMQQGCHYLRPLIAALLSLAAILSGPLFFTAWPARVFWYISVLPVAFFTLVPCLFLYAQALSSAQPWRWQRTHLRHFWPLIIAAPLSLLIGTLPGQEQQAMFFSGNADLAGQVLLVAFTFFMATLLWLGLSLFYLIRILSMLRSYRRELRQVFAEDAGKRMRWLDALLVALLVTWVYAVLVLVMDELVNSVWFNDSAVLILAMILIWLLGAFGLTQRPGFADPDASPGTVVSAGPCVEKPVVEASQDQDKYQRSALGDEQAQRIAAKIQQAVYQDALYLDATLTLYKLAAYMGVPAHYVSQTLNQRLQQSFYDCINEARVAAAKQRLSQSGDSVLTIAMDVGFNARSSFYKAFKNSTGLTPVQYRKQQAKEQA